MRSIVDKLTEDRRTSGLSASGAKKPTNGQQREAESDRRRRNIRRVNDDPQYCIAVAVASNTIVISRAHQTSVLAFKNPPTHTAKVWTRWSRVSPRTGPDSSQHKKPKGLYNLERRVATSRIVEIDRSLGGRKVVNGLRCEVSSGIDGIMLYEYE